MRNGIAVLSLTLAAILLVSTIVYVPGSEADDAEYGTGKYGATYSFNTQEIDNAIKDITGRNLSEWVEYFSDKSEYYTYSLDKADAISKFAITRDTVQDGDEYTIDDHLSGYFKLRFDADATGPFPEEGVYDADSEEPLVEFIHRIFVDERSEDKRYVEAHFDIQIYVDIDVVTHADLSTGEITDSYIKLRAAIFDKEKRNIDFHVYMGDDYYPSYATLDYNKTDEDNNFFLDIEMGLTMEGMKVFTDRTDEWTVRPVVTEHVDKFVISSDLANTIWLELLASSEEDMSDSKLPKLILELIGSGGRMLDLFDTIKSLTSSEVPDISVTGTFRAKNMTDARGYEYCQLTLVNKDGTYGTVFKLAKAAYTLNLSDFVMMIPDYVIDHDKKQDIADIIGVLQWNNIDVCDISNNSPKQDECSMVKSYVNQKILEDDVESYPVPFEYRIIAYVGLGISVVLMLMIWRRII